MNTKALLVLLLALAVAPTATATSFIQECQYLEYRTNQSDAVFTGRVADFTEGGGLIQDAHGEVTFEVINTTKGAASSEFTLYQPGSLSGGVMIPAMTLEWNKGDVYTIQARESEQGYELVCGVMGRQVISYAKEPAQQPLSCRDIPSVAINPHTQEREEYDSECWVPRGWTLVTRSATPDNATCEDVEVVAANENGERITYDSECDVPRGYTILERTQAQACAQVITYAKDPETGDVVQYPTPCDVPEGWAVVDEPQEAEHEDTPKPSVWQKIRGWLANLF